MAVTEESSEKKLQEMLVEIRTKLNAAMDFAKEHDLNFSLGEQISFRSNYPTNAIDEDDLTIEETWTSSYDPNSSSC